jgi:hypothetical protein
MEKIQKERKRKKQSGTELIDGPPILRGMFVYPESLIENLLPPKPDRNLSIIKDNGMATSIQEENNWGYNWTGED